MAHPGKTGEGNPPMKTGQAGLRPGPALALVAAAFLGGCGPNTVRLEVPLRAVDGTEPCRCYDLAADPGGFFAGTDYDEAREAGKDHLDMALPAGTLLLAEAPRKDDSIVVFPFFLEEDDEGRSLIGADPSMQVGLLNGRPVFMDLADPNVIAWLRTASERDVRAIRSVGLSGDSAVDVVWLGHLSRRPLAAWDKTEK